MIAVIKSAGNAIVSPPARRGRAREVESEEYDEGRDNQAAIQSGRRDVVVLQPPAQVAALDEVVEDDAHGSPAEEDVNGRGGQQACAAVDDGRADVAPDGLGPASREQPADDRRGGPDEPEPLQRGIGRSVAEDAGRTDGSPDDRRREEDAPVGARVLVWLLGTAHVGDVVDCPVQDADLHNGRPNRGDELRGEHDARGHLHVVAELEILSEIEGLRHGDVSVILEHHHGQGPPRHHVADDELGQDVEAQLDVGDGLDETDGNEPDDGDQ